jgi:L-fuculose-phosphate aldolase
VTQEHLRSELADIGHRVGASGLVVGAGGNISARLPEGDMLAISPSGYRLEDLAPDDFVVIDLDGERRDGKLKPSSEWPMHTAAFRARPDAGAVIHLHPPYATLLHALDREIRLITIDHAYYVRRAARVGYYHSGTSELAEAVAAELADANVVLMKHHGCVVVSDTLDLAFHRVLNLEEAAKATYRALQIGDTTTVCPPAYLERVMQLEASTDGYAYGQR